MYPPLTSKNSHQPAALVPEELVVLVIPLVKYESLRSAGHTTFGCTTSPTSSALTLRVLNFFPLEHTRTSWSIYSHDTATLSEVNIHYSAHSTIYKLLG